MSEKLSVISRAGLKDLEEELQLLRTVKRKEVAEKIKEARGQGDLSENAEYDAAKEEQAEIEARIAIIEKTLRETQVIDQDNLDKDIVSIGSTVKVLDEFGDEMEFYIGGTVESNPFMGKISNESPLGQALLQRSIGDDVEVEAPDGVIRYKVISIQIPENQR
ncbi:MAG: transcription elongation factor GreA [Clostridiales bacterium]|nr:transcription elongation factor GreA [Clostridiales bacterium]